MSIRTDPALILAADIGATNSRFALFRAEPADESAPLLELLREKWFAGANYTRFTDVLEALRANTPEGPPLLLPGERPDIAVIAPAGPIQGDTCRISNLPWLVDGNEAGRILGIDAVRLINDFAAQAFACLIPEHIDVRPVLPGEERSDYPAAVVGAGTGCGHALLFGAAPPQSGESRADRLRRLGRTKILPSEGGHADFPFSGPREADFAAFAADRAKTGRLIGDSIVSGSGLAHLVAFLTGHDVSPRQAPAAAMEHPEVLEWFARFYGRACRSYVLYTLALGGLYITGGMAQRLPVLAHPAFAEEFRLSAAQGALLEKIPVRHVRSPQAGLWGAALSGLLWKR